MSGRTTNYTADLRRAKGGGARIVCSVAPYDGDPVLYRPRSKGDPSPWVLASGLQGYRYNGRECNAVKPNSDDPQTTGIGQG